MKLKFLAVATCLALTSAAHAQDSAAPDFTALLSGSSHPLTLKFKDLTPRYRRLVVSPQGDTFNDYMQMIVGMKGVEAGVYYTMGETISVGDETYLVAYRSQLAPDFTAIMNHGHGDPVVPQRPVPGTELALSLLNLRNAGSLNNVRSFDPKRDMQSPSEGAAASLRTLVILARGVRTAIQANGGEVPTVGTAVTPQLRRAFYPHVHDERTWRNPMTNEYYKPNPAISGLDYEEVQNAKYLPAFYEAEAAGDGTRGVAFLDGHAERITAVRWERISKVKPILLSPSNTPTSSMLEDAATATVKVKKALMATSALSGTNINVSTTERTITLMGTVRTRKQYALATAITRKNAPGYRVVNSLKVG